MARRLTGPETCPDCGMDGLSWRTSSSGYNTYLAEGAFKPHKHTRRRLDTRMGGYWVAPLSPLQFAGSPQSDTPPVDPGTPTGDAGGAAAGAGDGGAGV